MKTMKAKQQIKTPVYADELLKLVFAEDQAALYSEGFVVLSCHPYVKRQMKFLLEDTNRHLLSLLKMLREADREMKPHAEIVEAQIAEELALVVDASNIDRSFDDSFVQAATRMQDYLIALYRRAMDAAAAAGYVDDRKKLNDICKAKLERLGTVTESITPTSHPHSLPVFSTTSLRQLNPVSRRSFFKASLQ
jgi:ferritin-like metal-binding protein YciE